MPYFVYKIDVERVPAGGEVVVLSDGLIIKGGDMEYPERYSPNGNYITLATITFYTPAGKRISNTTVKIVCERDQQNEYYPLKE